MKKAELSTKFKHQLMPGEKVVKRSFNFIRVLILSFVKREQNHLFSVAPEDLMGN